MGSVGAGESTNRVPNSSPSSGSDLIHRLPDLSPQRIGFCWALGLIFLLTSIHRLHPTDLWGHLNFGRWIVQHGQLPQSDPFRQGMPSEPFVPAWWLSQVIGYGWYRLFGLEGLVVGHAVLVTLMIGLLMGATAARGVQLGWATAAGLLGWILALPILGVIRPQLFGMVAFAATLWAIARLIRRWDPIMWLGALFALWANLHGSFLLGLGALGCHLVGMLWDRWAAGAPVPQQADSPSRWPCGFQDGRICRAGLALLVAAAASCLNPQGIHLFATVTSFSSHEPLQSISEWRPMTLRTLSGMLMLCSVLATGVLLRWSPRRLESSEVLLGLVFGIASVWAIRMLAWWAIVWPWLAAPHLGAIYSVYGKTPAPKAPPGLSQLTLRWAILWAGLTVCLWWAPPVHSLLTGRSRPPEAILSKDTPESLAQFLLDHQIQGRLYAPMQWADYLVWRTHSAVIPLVHCHVHLIPPEVWKDFLALERASPIWPRLVDKYQLDYLVVHRTENPLLAVALQQHPRAELVWKEASALVVRWNKPP